MSLVRAHSGPCDADSPRHIRVPSRHVTDAYEGILAGLFTGVTDAVPIPVYLIGVKGIRAVVQGAQVRRDVGIAEPVCVCIGAQVAEVGQPVTVAIGERAAGLARRQPETREPERTADALRKLRRTGAFEDT